MDHNIEVLEHSRFMRVSEEISSVFEKLDITSDFGNDFSFIGVKMLEFGDVLEESHELGMFFHD